MSSLLPVLFYVTCVYSMSRWGEKSDATLNAPFGSNQVSPHVNQILRDQKTQRHQLSHIKPKLFKHSDITKSYHHQSNMMYELRSTPHRKCDSLDLLRPAMHGSEANKSCILNGIKYNIETKLENIINEGTAWMATYRRRLSLPGSKPNSCVIFVEPNPADLDQYFIKMRLFSQLTEYNAHVGELLNYSKMRPGDNITSAVTVWRYKQSPLFTQMDTMDRYISKIIGLTISETFSMETTCNFFSDMGKIFHIAQKHEMIHGELTPFNLLLYDKEAPNCKISIWNTTFTVCMLQMNRFYLSRSDLSFISLNKLEEPRGDHFFMSPRMVLAILESDMSWITSQYDLYSVIVIGWYWYQTVCNLNHAFDFNGIDTIEKNTFCQLSRDSFSKQNEIYAHDGLDINERAQVIQQARQSDIMNMAAADFKNTQEYSLMMFIRKYIILMGNIALFHNLSAVTSLSWAGFLNDLQRSSCKHYIK